MDAMGEEEVRQHVKILPQCQLQPFADTELAMWSHYWPGDFMVHFAGSFDFIDRFQAYAAASHPTASLYVSCHLSLSLLLPPMLNHNPSHNHPLTERSS